MDPEAYLIEVKAKLAVCSFIRSIDIIDERIVLSDRGYFRAQITLINGDFLEVSEYFVLEEVIYIPKRYRYQWMDVTQRHLRKRWDNAEHFPSLTGFPHHVHIGDEKKVAPFKPIRILDLIDIIEKEVPQ